MALLMLAGMRATRHRHQVVWGVVGTVVVPMMDNVSDWNGPPVDMLPDSHVQAPSSTLEVGSAAVVAASLKDLNRGRDDRDHWMRCAIPS
jgi:hypothetical protein